MKQVSMETNLSLEFIINEVRVGRLYPQPDHFYFSRAAVDAWLLALQRKEPDFVIRGR